MSAFRTSAPPPPAILSPDCRVFWLSKMRAVKVSLPVEPTIVLAGGQRGVQRSSSSAAGHGGGQGRQVGSGGSGHAGSLVGHGAQPGFHFGRVALEA